MDASSSFERRISLNSDSWAPPRRMAMSTSVHLLICTTLLVILSFVTSYIVSIKTGHNDPRNVLLFLGILRGWMTILAVAIVVGLLAVVVPKLLGYRSMLTTFICMLIVGAYHLLNLNNPNVELFEVGLMIMLAFNLKDTIKHLLLSFIIKHYPKSKYRSADNYRDPETPYHSRSTDT